MVKKKGVPASPKTKHLQTPNTRQSAPFIRENLREPLDPFPHEVKRAKAPGGDSQSEKALLTPCWLEFGVRAGKMDFLLIPVPKPAWTSNDPQKPLPI